MITCMITTSTMSIAIIMTLRMTFPMRGAGIATTAMTIFTTRSLTYCHGADAHGPEPDELAGPGGWHRGVSAVVSVGLRPCSGAIIVLVFALAQGMFWAGVASTFVMGVGTAITVGTIATLAVGAKALAKRFASERSGYGIVVVRGAEVGAAALVLAFGVLLLTGYMVSERMVGF